MSLILVGKALLSRYPYTIFRLAIWLLERGHEAEAVHESQSI